MADGTASRGVARLTAGRVTLPEEFLSRLNLKCGDLVTISPQDNQLVIEKLSHLQVIPGGREQASAAASDAEAPALRPAAG